MHGKITYVDVVNQVAERGWNIVSQTPNSTEIETQVGVPRIPALLLALIPVLGAALGALWVYQRGSMNVTIERKLTSARVVTPSNAFDINSREDLETFFTLHNYAGNIGYYPLIITGVIVAFIVGLLVQVGGPVG